MTSQDDIEHKCYTLWTALKDLDTIECTPKQKDVMNTLLGYCARDINQVFRTLGVYNLDGAKS